MRLGVRAILLGFFLTVAFSVASIYQEMVVRNFFTLTDTLIPVLTYFFLIVVLLVVNPILRCLYQYVANIKLFRPFNRHEILLVTLMTLVTSGVAGLGLTYYLIPMIGTVNSPARSTSQSDWGLMTQTVLKMEVDGNTKTVYGDIEEENEMTITLRHYDGKGKGQDEIKTYQKKDVVIQKPLIRPELVLSREDAKVFESGLPEIEVVDPTTGKKSYHAQNAMPAFLPKPKELPADYKKRIGEYLKNGKLQEGYTFWGNVPWVAIGKPFCYWLIFVLLLYLSLFALAKILFTQWAKYERLQFPLAAIPQALMGDTQVGDENSKNYPTYSIWKNLYFVIGFVLALSLILLAGLYTKFSLYLAVQDYVGNTIFEGLKDMRLELHIFFLIIGIAYIVPKEISFSVWFFGLVFIFQILFAVWFGFGKSYASFQTDYYTKVNFFTAQAFGGVVVFSSLALWNVRHYLLSGIYKIFKWRPNSVKEEVIIETARASILFIISAIGIIFVLLWMNISLGWTLIYSFITLLFIVAAIRVASECGIIGFQNITGGGTHFISNMIGIRNLGTESYVNAVLLQVIFFFDTKTFLAPNVMVAQKVEDENKMEKTKFWTVLFLAIILSAFTSFAFLSILVYHQGISGLEDWYFVGVPNGVFNTSIQILKGGPKEQLLDKNLEMTVFLFLAWSVWQAFYLLVRNGFGCHTPWVFCSG